MKWHLKRCLYWTTLKPENLLTVKLIKLRKKKTIKSELPLDR